MSRAKHLPQGSLLGVLPVVQVPYRNDESIDWNTLKKEVDFLFDHGVNGLVTGMVSEVQRLTESERDKLTENLVRFSAGRGPVIASVGGESIAQMLRHAKAAETAGADGLMAIPPATTRCSDSEILNYYRALVRNTTKPVIVQDASGYLGNPIPIQTQVRLFSEFPTRIMFKPEAQPIGTSLSLIRDGTKGKAALFEGTGGIALVDTYQRGIIGTMPGAEIPWAMVALWRALENGDFEKARIIHAPIAAMVSMMHCLDAFIAIEKLLLKEQGIFKNTMVRGPVAFFPDPETKAEVLRIFVRLKQICGP